MNENEKISILKIYIFLIYLFGSLLVGILVVLFSAMVFHYLNILQLQTFINNLPLAIPFVIVWIFPGLLLMRNKLNVVNNVNKDQLTAQLNSKTGKIFNEENTSNFNITPHFYIRKLIYQSKTYTLSWIFKIGIPLVILTLILSGFFGAIFVTGFNLTSSIKLLVDTFVIIIIPAIFIAPIFIPILILLHNITPKEFKNMIESLSLGDFKGLSNDIETYENSNEFKYSESSKFLYWFCKSNLLLYLHNYSESLDILNNELNNSNKNVAFYQEILFLTGNCYTGLGEIEKAKELYSESLIGFKKFKITEPIELLEKMLGIHKVK